MPIAETLSHISWFSMVVKRILFLLNIRRERPSPIDPKLRRQLQEEFAPEVARLSKLLGRDLTYWSRQ
jgi:hypothetical protein